MQKWQTIQVVLGTKFRDVLAVFQEMIMNKSNRLTHADNLNICCPLHEVTSGVKLKTDKSY